MFPADKHVGCCLSMVRRKYYHKQPCSKRIPSFFPQVKKLDICLIHACLCFHFWLYLELEISLLQTCLDCGGLDLLCLRRQLGGTDRDDPLLAEDIRWGTWHIRSPGTSESCLIERCLAQSAVSSRLCLRAPADALLPLSDQSICLIKTY